MVVEIIDAALAPLRDPLGWQAFAYGLLGLKTLRKVIDFAREQADKRTVGGSNNE